jgi:hypothetical protein
VPHVAWGNQTAKEALETKLAPLSIAFAKANQMTDGGCLKVLPTSPQAPPLPPQFTHSANLHHPFVWQLLADLLLHP